jgi:hypothetical protein
LETYVLSKQELLRRVIKSKFPWENNGIYLPEETLFIKNRISKDFEAYNKFIASLDNISEDLAKNFWEYYDLAYRPLSRHVDFYSSLLNRRAIYLFPVSNRKTDKIFSQLPLSKKLEQLPSTVLQKVFDPCELVDRKVNIAREALVAFIESKGNSALHDFFKKELEKVPKEVEKLFLDHIQRLLIRVEAEL